MSVWRPTRPMSKGTRGVGDASGAVTLLDTRIGADGLTGGDGAGELPRGCGRRRLCLGRDGPVGAHPLGHRGDHEALMVEGAEQVVGVGEVLYAQLVAEAHLTERRPILLAVVEVLFLPARKEVQHPHTAIEQCGQLLGNLLAWRKTPTVLGTYRIGAALLGGRLGAAEQRAQPATRKVRPRGNIAGTLAVMAQVVSQRPIRPRIELHQADDTRVLAGDAER